VTQQINNLISRLCKSLREDLMKVQSLLDTRDGVLALAQRLERATDGRHRHTDRPNPTGHTLSGTRNEKADRNGKNKKYDDRTRKRNDGDKKEDRPQSNRSANTALECYNCHRKGHYSTSCPYPKSDKPSKISKANGLALGKDRAST